MMDSFVETIKNENGMTEVENVKDWDERCQELNSDYVKAQLRWQRSYDDVEEARGKLKEAQKELDEIKLAHTLSENSSLLVTRRTRALEKNEI